MKRVLDLDVIVVAFNGIDVIGDCLDSIKGSTCRPGSVLVIDNDSSDQTRALVRRNYPFATVVSSATNRGFAGGCNLALTYSRAGSVLLLNQDATVQAETIERLRDVLDADASIASSTPKILFRDRPDTINAAGLLLTASAYPVSRGRGEVDRGQYDAPGFVFGAHGACALFRRSALDHVGGLDEDYFAYHEEFDLAWRLALAGFRCRYVPQAVCHHREAYTLRSQPDRMVYLMERNRIWTLIKNMPAGRILGALPALVRAELNALRHCVGCRTIVPLMARWHALLGLPATMRKRRLAQALRAVPDQHWASTIV